MSDNTVEGVIKIIEETKIYGKNGFRKRLMIVETTGQYPQLIPVEFIQDKSDLPNSFIEGEEVKVSINLMGSQYQEKYYVALNGWRIDRLSTFPSANTTPPVKELPNEPETPPDDFNDVEGEEDNDGLPF